MAKPGDFTKEDVKKMVGSDRRQRAVIACRPQDWSSFPADTHPEQLGLTIGPPTDHTPSNCQLCDCPVLIGPNQMKEYEQHPDDYWVLDFLCSVSLMAQVTKTKQAPLAKYRGRA